MATRIYMEYLYIWTISNKTSVNNKIFDLFEVYNFSIKFVLVRLHEFFHVSQVIRRYKSTTIGIFSLLLCGYTLAGYTITFGYSSQEPSLRAGSIRLKLLTQQPQHYFIFKIYTNFKYQLFIFYIVYL